MSGIQFFPRSVFLKLIYLRSLLLFLFFFAVHSFFLRVVACSQISDWHLCKFCFIDSHNWRHSVLTLLFQKKVSFETSSANHHDESFDRLYIFPLFWALRSFLSASLSRYVCDLAKTMRSSALPLCMNNQVSLDHLVRIIFWISQYIELRIAVRFVKKIYLNSVVPLIAFEKAT